MTDLGRVEETHSHEIRTTPLMRGVIVWLVILTVAVAVLGLYLNDRYAHRDDNFHTSICTLLNEVPVVGHPFLIQARQAFGCPAVK